MLEVLGQDGAAAGLDGNGHDEGVEEMVSDLGSGPQTAIFRFYRRLGRQTIPRLAPA